MMCQSPQIQIDVPAHTGGVDLRYEPLLMAVPAGPVPAHTVGVDLRHVIVCHLLDKAQSPPTRAGWI